MPKKNPIKKRRQGSQKPNPIPVGKPEQYMGDNEWEQYNEPQGAKKDMVNPEGLGGIKIGEAVVQVSSPIFGSRAQVQVNPSVGTAKAIMEAYDDVMGLADGENLYLWYNDEVKHDDVVKEVGADPNQSVYFVYTYGRASDPERKVVVSSWNMPHRNLRLVESIFKSNPNYRKVFGRVEVDAGEMKDKLPKYVPGQPKPSFAFTQRVSEEMGPLGGFMAPLRGSDSKFAIPDNMAIIDPESFEFSSLDQTKKDARKVRKQVNKNIRKQQSDPNFEDELNEMIRLPIFSLISGEYEVRNGEQIAGFARVKDGVIEELTCASGAEEDYRGEVLTHLLNTIIEEADMQNSNLSLQLQNKDDDDMKRFLERFGFKHVGHGVMQRTAGAVRPPSVQYTSGQEGP